MLSRSENTHSFTLRVQNLVPNASMHSHIHCTPHHRFTTQITFPGPTSIVCSGITFRQITCPRAAHAASTSQTAPRLPEIVSFKQAKLSFSPNLTFHIQKTWLSRHTHTHSPIVVSTSTSAPC